MAETSEQVTGAPAAPPPSAGPLPAPPGAESAEPYRPLSVLAITAFCLGFVYAFLVVFGGLAIFATRYPGPLLILAALAALAGPLRAMLLGAPQDRRSLAASAAALGVLASVLGLGSLVGFSGSHPVFWPLYFLPLALAALVCAWMASAQIRSSENAYGGLALTRWAAGLSVFFGLTYLAYYASIHFAVRTQAADCAEEYLTLIRDGKLQEAFLSTLPQTSRPAPGSDLREALEIQYNTPRGPGEPGVYSTFLHDGYVRMIQLAGKEATWTLKGTESIFERGAYQVALVYRVHTPWSQFELSVVTKGVEAADSSGALRRQWHIDSPSTVWVQGTRRLTPEGERMARAHAAALELVNDWLTRLNQQQPDSAYLGTVPPRSRQRQAGAIILANPALLALSGPAVVPATGVTREAVEAFNAGREAFRKGAILDASDFYADKKARDEMLTAVHNAFAGTAGGNVDLTLTRFEVPDYKEEGDKVTVGLPVRVTIRDPDRGPRYILEAEAFVEGPKAVGPLRGLAYQVTKFRLERGQTAPDMNGPKPRR